MAKRWGTNQKFVGSNFTQVEYLDNGYINIIFGQSGQKWGPKTATKTILIFSEATDIYISPYFLMVYISFNEFTYVIFYMFLGTGMYVFCSQELRKRPTMELQM